MPGQGAAAAARPADASGTMGSRQSAPAEMMTTASGLHPAANALVRISPAVGEFSDIDTGLIYVIRFTIFNASKRVQRVRFKPPQTPAFKLVTFPQSIAPGLVQEVEVEFCTKEQKDLDDRFTVLTDVGAIDVPLHAWFPRPNIQLEDEVNLGVVAVQHNASRAITLSNTGKRPGQFSFRIESGTGLTITPASGTIQPGKDQRVEVNYYGQDVGYFMQLVPVHLPGQSTRQLKVTARVTESKVEIVHSQDRGPVTGPVDFGTLYFGQRRVEEVQLRNNAPFPASFSVHSPEEAEEDWGDDDGRPATPLPPPIEVFPVDGRIGPGSSVTLRYTFQPVFREEKQGFLTTRERPKAGEWSKTFGIEIVETEQKLEVGFRGRAVHTDVSFSETSFRFGDAQVNTRADIQFTASNRAELPVELDISRAAHFSVRASKQVTGPPWRLGAHSTMAFTLTFKPNQLGRFRRTLTAVVSGVQQLMLQVIGTATRIGPRRPLVGGPGATADDFTAQTNWVDGERQPPKTAPTATEVREARDTKEPQRAWEDSEELELGEFEQKVQHQRLYNGYLTQARLNREHNCRLIRERELADKEQRKAEQMGTFVDRSLLDIGMTPAEGLMAPEPKLLRKEDPLWLDFAQQRGDEGGGVRRPVKSLKFDENKLVKRKFKKEPTTLNEQRECKMVLSPKDIVHITIGPKVLDFGRVSVFSRNVKSFHVSNELLTHILVKIPVSIRDELRHSTPASQVIPPGQTAGFDIVFQSDVEQNFTQAMWFQLNDNHKLKFLVLAEAVPIDVSLSQERMEFRFNDYVLDPTLTQNLTLTNNGNTDAEFKWSVDESAHGAFAFSPVRGTVPALGHLNIDITYTPQLNALESSCSATLEVKGGPKRILELAGSVQESRCSFSQQKLDFGCIAVGSSSTKSVSIRNSGPSSTVFYLSHLPPGMTVSNARARLAPGQSVEVAVTLRPTAAQPYQATLTCTVRGMKQQLKLFIKAEAKVPQVEVVLAEDRNAIDFGEVFVGGQSFEKMVLRNDSTIPAALLLDLTDFPQFFLADHDTKPVEGTADPDDQAGDARRLGGAMSVWRDPHDDEGYDDDDDEASDEEAQVRQRRGRKYRIVVFEKQSLLCHLGFAPTAVAPLPPFPLLLSLAGIPATDQASHDLMREVRAAALKPQLVLSHTTIDFGSRVVAREGTSKAPNHVVLRLTNEVEEELEWDLVIPGAESLAEVFRVSPTTGTLQPGHTVSVQVSFTPAEVRHYNMRVGVFLHRQREQKYMDIAVRGSGANPQLSFDRREVIMPVVPLDVPSRAVFNINNEGYDSLDLRWRLPGSDKWGEQGSLPIQLNFPDGSTISTTSHPQLAVEVICVAKKPSSFTASIDFGDEDDGVFSIPVTFLSDNCLLTTFPYLVSKRQADGQPSYSIAPEADKRPIMLRPHDEGGADTPRHQARSERSHASGYDTDQTSTHQQLERLYKKSYGRKHAERLRVWLNANLLQDPVDELVPGMQQSHGRPLVEIVEQLAGRPPPGALRLDRLPQENKKEVAAMELKQYEEITAFLKGYGALLSDMRPEYLLRYDDFCRLQQLPQPAKGWGAGVGATAPVPQVKGSGAAAGSKMRITERRFHARQVHAWMTLIYQLVRVFSLAKVTWKSLKSQPMSAVLSRVAQEEKWSSMAADPSLVGSNLYSVAESVLLRWLSVHVNAYFPRPAVTQTGDAARIISFEDLRDCRAFAAVLCAYIPTQQPRFGVGASAETVGSTFVPMPQSSSDYDRNASLVLESMKAHGMDVKLTAKDIADATARDLLLLSLFLYHNLPQFIPQATIRFRGRLHETITKSVELTNPHKWPIDYLVLLEDDSGEFRIDKQDNKLHLDPRSSASVPIWITPRFSRRTSGRLTFLAQGRLGGTQASTMTFDVVTDIDNEHAARTFDIETPLYEPLTYEFDVDNQFEDRGNFQIQYIQERVKEEPVKGKQKEPPPSYGEESSLALFQEPFWMSQDSIQIKKKDTAKLSIQFIPFIRGKYRCRVVLCDDRVGEFMYCFNATAQPPVSCDKITFQTEASQTQQREAVIPAKNAAMERGSGVLHNERFRGFKKPGKGAEKAKDFFDTQELRYKVEYTSPFFSGPKEVVSRPPPAVDTDDARKNKQLQRPPTNFPVTFNPKGPGVYPARIILTSHYDVRVIDIEGKSRSPGMKADLDFSCHARQVITQDIPITNKSAKDWTVQATLTGEYFSGPREVHVKAGKVKTYPLVFAPQWVCGVSGQLVLKNSESLERYTYNLRGRAEEPLAETTLVVECPARETRSLPVTVPNITHDEVTYAVETDLPFARGEPTLTVPKLESGKYLLHLSPTINGKSTGSITFVAPNKQHVWYVVQVTCTRPPPETKIEVEATVRRAVVAEISIGNPTDQELDFVVRRRGEGLLGDNRITLGPREDGLYQLIYSPLRATPAGQPSEGQLSFYNDEIGEYWYVVRMTALEAPPEELPEILCELGKSAQIAVTIENPAEQELTLSAQNTNDQNFSVSPWPAMTLKPFGSAQAVITFMPSAIAQRQEGVVRFVHPKLGKWEYIVRGKGSPPTLMERLTVHSTVGRSAQASVVFRNPFPIPRRYSVALKGTPGEFALMIKRRTNMVNPFAGLTVPLSYSPDEIAEHQTAVIVQAVGEGADDLRWEYPVVGVAEAEARDNVFKFVCKSRSELTQTVHFPLHQLTTDDADETFTHQLVFPTDHAHIKAVQNAVVVQPYEPGDDQSRVTPAPGSPDGLRTLPYVVNFSPLRSFSATCELLLSKKSGGLWRFELNFEAQPPPPDDTIVLEAAVAQIGQVSFSLCNVFTEEHPFRAYFTPESPAEFTVSPAKGFLPGAVRMDVDTPRSRGQNFVVSFSSSQYGKTLHGTLTIETDMMEWRYDVRGTLPRYHAPTAAQSRLDFKLRDETQRALGEAAGRRTDFVKRNQASVPRRMGQQRTQQRMMGA
eukprot:TRINITY_DN736_c0_g1_i2.p1 TRINITY_DN736_c0_g1~~TRINITY_DN736_c0_g1_i2.p1  ORF type:complete len:2968 (+),score=1059.89 TRINITY_DN736_c0_g1_i2:73-8904(+)